MGYQRSLLKLVFQDPEFEGLEVTMRRPSIGRLHPLAALQETVRDPDVGADATMAAMDQILATLAESLASWNLETDQGAPVAPDLEGLRGQDPVFIMTVMEAWLDAAVGVAPPLPRPSSDGVPSEVGQIPMETLSVSLPN